MPKGKGTATKDKKKTSEKSEKDDIVIATLVKKEVVVDDEEKELDPEVIVGEELEAEESEEEGLLDNDEVNPFGDKWEE